MLHLPHHPFVGLEIATETVVTFGVVNVYEQRERPEIRVGSCLLAPVLVPNNCPTPALWFERHFFTAPPIRSAVAGAEIVHFWRKFSPPKSREVLCRL